MASDQDLGLEEYFADFDRRAAERRARRGSRRAPRRVRRPRELRHLGSSPAGRVLIGLVAAIAALTIVGLAVLWPHGGLGRRAQPLSPSIPARVEAVREAACDAQTPQRCRVLVIRVGRERGTLRLGPVLSAPDVAAGQAIRVTRVAQVRGAPTPPHFERYSFVDVERRGSVLLALGAVALLALVLLRLRGLLATLGVVLSLVLLLKFLVPAILDGRPPVLVALVGSLSVMFVTVILTNGLGAQSMAATLGITATLLLACGLAALGIHVASLDGRSDELTLMLTQQTTGISLKGVVLAGMIIGALGVLADTAVTQASAVMALRRASPQLGAGALYRQGIAVGRDHLSATIHTLVLAYAGASLPLLLIIASSRMATPDALNSQSIAEPAIATAVGCVALIAAVPLTTGLAAALVGRVPADALSGHHGHHH